MLYLDFAATTPIDPDVQRVILDSQKELWANPSSPHTLGRAARSAIDTARTTIASRLGFKSSECIFTASGSESVHLGIAGVCDVWEQKHGKYGHIVTTAVEHKCVLETCKQFELRGWNVTYIPVDTDGHIDLSFLENALQDDTAIVSIQWVNNETGVLQPIESIATICSRATVPFHCDASQAIGHAPLLTTMPDLLTIAAHKLYGPKGIGALLVREKVDVHPQIRGGGQEFDLRAGTENTPAIAGFASALSKAIENTEVNEIHIQKMSDYMISKIVTMPNVTINADRTTCLPGIVNIHVHGQSGETLVMQLDMKGICISTGSACTTGSSDPSHVLSAMGQNKEEVRENIRVSIGKNTTVEDIDVFCQVLSECIKKESNS